MESLRQVACLPGDNQAASTRPFCQRIRLCRRQPFGATRQRCCRQWLTGRHVIALCAADGASLAQASAVPAPCAPSLRAYLAWLGKNAECEKQVNKKQARGGDTLRGRAAAQRSGGPPPRSRGGPPPQRVVWPSSVKASWKLIYKCSPVCGRMARCRVSTAVRRSCGPGGSGSPRPRGPGSVIPQAFGHQLLPMRNQACPQ